MPKKQDFCCLMFETPDKHRFFTYEKNLSEMKEFSRAFGGEVSVVEVKEADVMDLQELIPEICNPTRKRSKYKLIRTEAHKRTVFQIARKVRKHIRKKFMSGKVVILQEIHQQFTKNFRLGLSTVCNHISTVRKELKAEGYQIVKLGGGKYQMQTYGMDHGEDDPNKLEIDPKMQKKQPWNN
jgi:flavodoxin